MGLKTYQTKCQQVRSSTPEKSLFLNQHTYFILIHKCTYTVYIYLVVSTQLKNISQN